jgi:uncharacterized membrane protein YkoI
MTKNRVVLLAFTSFLAMGVTAAAAYANDEQGDQDKRDSAALAEMKISLPQAITTAEQSAAGRAVSADLVTQQGVTSIAVEVVGPQGVKTVLVNAQSGQLIATPGGSSEEDEEEN